MLCRLFCVIIFKRFWKQNLCRQIRFLNWERIISKRLEMLEKMVFTFPGAQVICLQLESDYSIVSCFLCERRFRERICCVVVC